MKRRGRSTRGANSRPYALVASLALAACANENNLPTSVSMSPLPTIEESTGIRPLGESYHSDEEGELWAITTTYHSDVTHLFRYDCASAAWSEIETGGLYAHAFSGFGSSSDGKLIVPIGGRWYYLAPGAVDLGAPSAAIGIAGYTGPAAMDAAGRLYAPARDSDQLYVARFQPGDSESSERVLDFSNEQLFQLAAAPNGAVYVVHGQPGSEVVDRFAPDGSGPTTVLEACDECPLVAHHWDWFPPEVGYGIPLDALREPAGIYRLAGGRYTHFADDVSEYGPMALSLLDDDTMLGFSTRIAPEGWFVGGLLARSLDAHFTDPWTQIGDLSDAAYPVPGPIVGHRWVEGSGRVYELMLE